MTNQLTTITAAAIAKIETPKEAVVLHYAAEAAAKIYKAQDDRESSQQMKVVYIRSARRAGELLLPENISREIGGDRKSTEYQSINDQTPYQEALDGAGVTDSQSRIWQGLAKISEDVLEQYFADPKYQWTEYTIKGLLSFALGGTSNGLTLEGALKKFQDVVTYIAVEFPDAIDDMRTLFDEILAE